jgi:hypothetical protein
MSDTQHRRTGSIIGAAVLALTFTVEVQAAQSVDQYLSISEFGTLGVVHSDYGQADFIGNVVQPKGAGYSGKWSVTPDSDLGVQANLTLTDKLTGVVQVLSRDNPDGNFTPGLEWANLKYDLTTDFSIRIGRIQLPTFQLSDVQNVGYAMPWVRIPLEFNYADSTEFSDGIELLYQMKTGPVSQQLQAQAGYSNENSPGADFATVRARLEMLSDTLQYGDTSGEVVYQHYEIAGIVRIQQDLVGLGLTYDPGPYLFMAACNYADNSFFGRAVAGYVGGGARFGKFTPYATYAITHATAVGSSGVVNLGNEHTIAAGLRWDFVSNFDAKLQIEQVTLDTLNDPAAFGNVQAGARPGDKAHIVSLTLDFVF